MARLLIADFRRICKTVVGEAIVFLTELAYRCTALLHHVAAQRRRSRRVSYLSYVTLTNPGDQSQTLSSECLAALSDLASSGNGDQQQAASTYYLYLSRRLKSPLPPSFMEPLGSLLLSSHPDVQKTTCLSLVKLLVKRNACKELVLDMGMLSPLLDMLQYGDTMSQCHACTCLTLLASESNNEALVSEGVIPLLALAKSYDPLVQQNAAWVLLHLTQTVSSRRVLCRVGAVPVLTGLLHSADSRVQFYGCSALGQLAAHAEHHRALLRYNGGRYLLQSLLKLMASAVEKNACQACKCLQMLCSSAVVREHLLELDFVGPLKNMLSSSVLDCVRSAFELLTTLSAQPPYQGVLVNEGVFNAIARTLQHHGSSGEVIAHTCTAVESLSCSYSGQEALMRSGCVAGLLQALISPVTPEDTLIRLTSCLGQLMTFDTLRTHVSTSVRSEGMSRLVQLSGPNRNQRIVYNCAAIISRLQINGGWFSKPRNPFPGL